MTLGKVVDLMKMDSSIKVTRAGWNGKGMFLFRTSGQEIIVAKNDLNFSRIFMEGAAINIQEIIWMKTADDTIVPWLASQTDLMADDWELLQKSKEK
jgi:hypothetical protein